MAYTTIISAKQLAENLHHPNWAIIDCRFSLSEPAKGHQDYLRAHIPGAVYAHLNEDLSNPHIPGKTGRHPLPAVEKMAAKFSEWGIDQHVQVVAYDNWPITGSIASRVWWLLHWLGHDAVAVLNGGFNQWLKNGFQVQNGEEKRSRRQFAPDPRETMFVNISDVDRMRTDPAFRLFDSRSADRYRGENETIDPIAGHIPGAISAPFTENMDVEGLFLPPERLHQRFIQLLHGVPVENSVFYCGSGVTATVNLLALAHAGLKGARLFPGSWSEWITDTSCPIAK